MNTEAKIQMGACCWPYIWQANGQWQFSICGKAGAGEIFYTSPYNRALKSGTRDVRCYLCAIHHADAIGQNDP